MTLDDESIPVLIVADDLTGAAEIAATATEFGIPAGVSRAGSAGGPTPFDVPGNRATAVDTDTRSVSAPEALQVISSLSPLPSARLVYKKTDSLLRGNPGPEILSLMQTMGKSRALLLPQNPSKNRVIRGGHYFIDQIPLHKTSFNADPEHPRLSSSIPELLFPTPITIIEPGQPPAPAGISVGNATTLDDIAAFARDMPLDVLPAGGVDFFRALLGRSVAPSEPVKRAGNQPTALRLVISGSASDYSRKTVQQWRLQDLPVHPLSCELPAILHSLSTHQLAVLAITDPIDPSRALYLRQALASRVREILTHPAMALHPIHLYMEGGATAAAAVEALDWRNFDVVSTLAPGVVTLRPARATHILLTIKPGSYPWPGGSIRSW